MSSNNEEKEIIIIINNLFGTCEKKTLNSLIDLANESLLKHLLGETDPFFEETNNNIQIMEKGSIDDRKLNLNLLIKSIQNFLENHHEKNRLLKPIKIIIESLIITDILLGYYEQMMLFAELLLVLSSLSTKKDFFLDKILTLEDNYQYLYLRKIDKYISSSKVNENIMETYDNVNLNKNKDSVINDLEFKKDLIDSENDYKKSMTLKFYLDADSTFENTKKSTILRANYLAESKFSRKIKKFDQEYKEQNKILEEEITELREEMESKNRIIMDYITKIKEFSSELQSYKEIIEDFEINEFEEKLSLKEKIAQNEKEIELLKEEFEKKERTFMEENQFYKEKVENYHKIIQKNKNLKKINKELKSKLSEYDKYKNKVLDYDNLVVTLKSVRIKSEDYINQIKSFRMNIEELIKNLNEEKKKTQRYEFEKNIVEIKFNELKENYQKLEKDKNDLLIRSQIKFANRSPLNTPNTFNFTIDENKSHHRVSTYNLDEVILDNENVFDSNLKEALDQEIINLKTQIEILKVEKADIITTSSDQSQHIFKLIEQRDNNLQEIDNLNVEILKLNREQDDLKSEIDKLSSTCLEQSETISLLSEKIKYLQEGEKGYKFKISVLIKEKENCLKENQQLRLQIKKSPLNQKLETNTFIQLKNCLSPQKNVRRTISSTVTFSSLDPYIVNPKKKNSPTNIYNQSPNYNLRRSKILLPNDSPDQKDSIGKLSDYTADSIISSPNRTDTIYQTLKNENDSLKLDVKSMKNALCLCKLDLQNLSNETENLRLKIESKEQIILFLKEKLDSLKIENLLLQSKIEENVDIFNKELSNRNEDILFLKHSYEDHIVRVESEHEMISNCLYELASQFMNLKNIISNNMNLKDSNISSCSSESINDYS